MTKEQALSKTISRFTNLLDGKVSSNVSVSTIISYYESLCNSAPTNVQAPVSGIMSNFIEEEIKEYEQEYDDLPY